LFNSLFEKTFMAIYRESPTRWRQRLLAIIVAMVLVIVIAIVALLVGRSVGGDPSKIVAHTVFDTVAQSLDLFSIEYDKARGGSALAQTGAPGAIRKAAFALTDAKDILRNANNAAAYDALQADIAALTTALNTSPLPDATVQINDANAQLAKLRAAIGG